MTEHSLTLSILPVAEASRARGVASIAAPSAVRVWLWSLVVLVFAMVVVGGATRLTESGLSITEWKPVSGSLPPLSAADWSDAFEKYKQIPQYAKMNAGMSLDSFKTIFLWEWSHRLLGRLIGFALLVPMIWFWVRGQLNSYLKPRLVAVLGLGGVQGFVGWWMVKSGLVDRVEVSQYRLATHLLLASITFAVLIWLAVSTKSRASEAALPAQGRLNRSAIVLTVLAFLQIGMGALVAGLRAGLTYNTWPLMDGKLVPPLEDLTRTQPFWRNFFENVTTVQFDHRLGAYVLLAFAVWHALDSWVARPASHTAKRAIAVASLVACQAALGIVTLVLMVPVWAGILHQAFAMIILAMIVVHCRRTGEIWNLGPTGLSVRS